MRWESSRMMLPEHVAALNQASTELEKIERPHLDEQKFEEIGRTLKQMTATRQIIEISYYKDGFVRKKIGYPDRLDPLQQQLTIRDLYGIQWFLPFSDILDVRPGESDTDSSF